MNGNYKMANDKLRELHGILAEKLLDKVKDPECKSADLNVARQFLRYNGIDAVPTDDSPLQKLINEMPFNEKPKTVIKNSRLQEFPIYRVETFKIT